MKPRKQSEKKIGIYCRVSTREQANSGYGIDVQKSKIKGYMEVFDIETKKVDYYIDEGCSAKNMKRNQLCRLIEDIKEDRLEIVIIYKLDRLSRSVIDVYRLIEMMIDHGCNLISVMDNIDIRTANGRMLVGLLAIIAQWELETILERTLDGLSEIANQGKFPGTRIPFGYDKEEGRLQINQAKAAIVVEMFGLACGGMTIKEIERHVERKYPDIKLSSIAIKNILMKKLYFGCYEYQKKTYRNIVPAIITEETYKQTQKIISKRFKVNESHKYYFGNKVRCVCGEVMEKLSTNKPNKKYFYYYCGKCNMRINQESLLEQALPYVYERINIDGKKKMQYRLSNQMKKVRKKMEEQYMLYSQNKISLKTYGMVMSLLNTELEELEAGKEIKNNSTLSEFWSLSEKGKKKIISETIQYLVVDLDLKRIVKIEEIKKDKDNQK